MPLKKAMQAIKAIQRGTVVFASELEPDAVGVMNGFVVNSELAKCTYGEFTWYFAVEQGENDSAADIAHRVAKATAPSSALGKP